MIENVAKNAVCNAKLVFCNDVVRTSVEDGDVPVWIKFVRFIDGPNINQRELNSKRGVLNVTDSTATLPADAIKFLRRQDVLRIMAISETEMYRRLHDGRFVPPVPYGERMKVWPAKEIWALADAYLQEKNDDEIRSLVAKMKEARRG